MVKGNFSKTKSQVNVLKTSCSLVIIIVDEMMNLISIKVLFSILHSVTHPKIDSNLMTIFKEHECRSHLFFLDNALKLQEI